MAKHNDSGKIASNWQFLVSGRFEGDTFILNAPGIREIDFPKPLTGKALETERREVVVRREDAHDNTIYCGKEGVKKHGYYWSRNLPQPNPRTYLSTVHVPGCDWEPEDDSHLDDEI